MTDNEAHGQAFEHGRTVGYEQCRKELLPCRIGDTVWGIRKGRGGSRWVAQGRVYRMYYADDMRLCICVKSVCFGFWGRQVFATRAEAEAAIAKDGRKLDSGRFVNRPYKEDRPGGRSLQIERFCILNFALKQGVIAYGQVQV